MQKILGIAVMALGALLIVDEEINKNVTDEKKNLTNELGTNNDTTKDMPKPAPPENKTSEDLENE